VERNLLTRVEPEYPASLRGLQIGGTVRLLVTISPKGNVQSLLVLGGNPILAESAMKAVQQWVYAAGRSQTKLEISIPFDTTRLADNWAKTFPFSRSHRPQFGILKHRADDLVVSDRGRGSGLCVVGWCVGIHSSSTTLAQRRKQASANGAET